MTQLGEIEMQEMQGYAAPEPQAGGETNNRSKYRVNVDQTRQSTVSGAVPNAESKEKKRCKLIFVSIVDLVSRLDPFRPALLLIESRFGNSVLSYFLFIRYLFYLNLFVTALIVVPIAFTIIWQPEFKQLCSYQTVSNSSNSSFVEDAQECSAMYRETIKLNTSTTSNVIDSVATFAFDLLQGTGEVQNSFAFLGFYCVTQTYRTDLILLLVLAIAYLLSFIVIVTKSAFFFRKLALSSASAQSCPYSTTVFAGWQFVISEKKAAIRRKQAIRKELARACQEHREMIAREEYSRSKRIKILIVRVLVGLAILGLQAAAAASIIYASNFSQDQLQVLREVESMTSIEFWYRLFFEYLPSLVIAGLNIIVPIIFRILLSWCSLTDEWQIRLRIISTILLRVFSLCILVLNIFSMINYCDEEKVVCGVCQPILCWETYFGQQIYKLMVLDVLLKVVLWIAVEVPRKVVTSCCDCLSFIGPKQFDIPTAVLDLAYLQTLSWLGMFFAPVLPLILFGALIYLFALMMISIFFTSSANVETMQRSKSTTFFAFVLLLLFALILLPVGAAVSILRPSQSCSPFRVWNTDSYTMIDSVIVLIRDSSQVVFDLLKNFGDAFVWIVGLTLIILCFWLSAHAHSKRVSIRDLQKKLSLIEKDKQFLINRWIEFDSLSKKTE